ncbi:hypothetical protein Yalta_086 [Yalta virus]|nr:hypothetical protein Yalta_086 [Yalta virus]
MLKYFSRKANLTDVLDYIDTKKPRLVISEYNCLIDNRMMKRDDEDNIFVKSKLINYINDPKTIEFKIIDNKFTLNEMNDGLKVNDFFEPIVQQQEVKFDFLELFRPIIHSEGSIWSVELDNYRKNNLVYAYINEEPYLNIDVFILFSTLIDAVSFLLVNNVSKNVHVVVFDIHSRYNESIKEEILMILEKE